LQVLDIVHEHNNNGSGETTPDIPLAILVPFNEIKEKWETFSAKELLEMEFKCVRECKVLVYLKHHF
jgi:hypothetical protein